MAVPAILVAAGKKVLTTVATNAASKGAQKSGGWGKMVAIAVAIIVFIVYIVGTGLVGAFQAMKIGDPSKSDACILFPEQNGDNAPEDLNDLDQSLDTPSAPTGAVPAANTAGVPNGTGTVVIPVPAGTYVTLRPGGSYGPRIAPRAGASTWHKGVDFSAPAGTPILAAADGVVSQVTAFNTNPPTPYVDVQSMVSGQLITTRYEHMSKTLVTVGQSVKAGETIALVGSEGISTGNHLHFEVYIGVPAGSNHTNPETWLSTNGAATLGVPTIGGGTPNYTGINLNATGAEVCQMNSGSGSGSGGVSNGSWGGYSNGQIPDSALASPDFSTSVRLRADAAAALSELNKAYVQAFGANIVVTDSYRSYEGQVQCQKTKGSLCAKPGTSNHGWGLAVDLGGGINSFGTPQHQWMVANASKYGWTHPSWAQQTGSKPEAWHWEFTGSATGGPGGGGGDGKTPDGARQMAAGMLASYGWGTDQYTCLNSLWTKESGWNYLAQNKSSGAYGIPQSLPGDKMASVSADWRSNPQTQITWGLNYIKGRYATPCAAWQHSQRVNWY